MSAVGSIIRRVRWMTNEEMTKEGWEHSSNPGVVLEMIGGGKIYASSDAEGNGPGAFFGESPAGDSVHIIPGGIPENCGTSSEPEPEDYIPVRLGSTGRANLGREKES